MLGATESWGALFRDVKSDRQFEHTLVCFLNGILGPNGFNSKDLKYICVLIIGREPSVGTKIRRNIPPRSARQLAFAKHGRRESIVNLCTGRVGVCKAESR